LRRNGDELKERRPVSEKSTARHAPPVSPERDSLRAIDPEFLRDQLEALLSSPVVATSGHSWCGSGQQSGDPARAESDTATDERDSEASADVRLLQGAFLAAAKST
jgi:hypothetical protein